MLPYVHDLTENNRTTRFVAAMKLYFHLFRNGRGSGALNVQHASHVSLDTARNERKTRVGCLIASTSYFLHSENSGVSTRHVQEVEHRVSAPR